MATRQSKAQNRSRSASQRTGRVTSMAEHRKTSGGTSRARTAGEQTQSRSRSSNMTIDHEEIRRWAEARGGKPACVRGTGGRRGGTDVGMIRIDFPTGPEPKLGHISWDEWFRAFEENNLALVYQEKTAGGQPSRFNKLIGREAVDNPKYRPRHASRQGRQRKVA